jgi:glycerol kinase
LVRAALEAMAYGTAEVIAAMAQDAGVDIQELRVDGGAAANDWLMEFQAGLLDVPVRRAALLETTALGAAGLAGLHCGVWPSAEAFLAAQGEARIFQPAMGKEERTALKGGWSKAVDAARRFAGPTSP